MKRFGKWLFWVVGGAALVHLLAIWFAPSVIMAIAVNRLEDRAGGVNTLFHAPRITEEARDVVRPAPDLAYSTCAYDVSNGALRLVLPQSEDYSSVSLFDDATNNFFALNDREVTGAAQEIWVVALDADMPMAPSDVVVVSAPSKQGIVLFRRVIPSDDAWARVDAERRNAVCEPL